MILTLAFISCGTQNLLCYGMNLWANFSSLDVKVRKEKST